MQDKTILFVSNFFGNGGAARVISLLAEELANRGYDVTICSFPSKYYEEMSHPLNVKFCKFEMKFTNKLLYKLERIHKLRKEIKRHKNPTIISFEYFMNMQTIIANIGLKNKVIISERNDPANMRGNSIIKTLRSILYRYADRIVFQTPDAKEYFSDKIQKKSIIIPNPITPNLPSPWNFKREKRIVNFCRLEKQKNLKLLIDSFEEFHKKHSDFILSIFGDGKEKNSLENYIKLKNLNHFINLNPSITNIHDEVKNSMMFVSTSNYEGLSNSMIEAMAIGLPTICTDCPCGGARMIIENKKNGMLVPVGDKEKIVQAMNFVAENKDFRDFISQNGVLIRYELSLDNIVDVWEGLIDNHN